MTWFGAVPSYAAAFSAVPSSVSFTLPLSRVAIVTEENALFEFATVAIYCELSRIVVAMPHATLQLAPIWAEDYSALTYLSVDDRRITIAAGASQIRGMAPDSSLAASLAAHITLLKRQASLAASQHRQLASPRAVNLLDGTPPPAFASHALSPPNQHMSTIDRLQTRAASWHDNSETPISPPKVLANAAVQCSPPQSHRDVYSSPRNASPIRNRPATASPISTIYSPKALQPRPHATPVSSPPPLAHSASATVISRTAPPAPPARLIASKSLNLSQSGTTPRGPPPGAPKGPPPIAMRRNASFAASTTVTEVSRAPSKQPPTGSRPSSRPAASPS
jgi:hypothetical protein